MDAGYLIGAGHDLAIEANQRLGENASEAVELAVVSIACSLAAIGEVLMHDVIDVRTFEG